MYKPPGGLYLEGRFNGGFLGGAYTWRGLFSVFYGIQKKHLIMKPCYREQNVASL